MYMFVNREHKSILANESAFDISKRQQEKFPKWFKERVRYKLYSDTLISGIYQY